MNEKAEIRLRRRAIRLLGLGIRPSEVSRRVNRSRGWLFKWRKRYATLGASGLHSQSRRPHRQPKALSASMTRLIAQTRRRLIKAKVGLTGSRAILHELQQVWPRRRLPSPITIYRKLHQWPSPSNGPHGLEGPLAGQIVSAKPISSPYYGP